MYISWCVGLKASKCSGLHVDAAGSCHTTLPPYGGYDECQPGPEELTGNASVCRVQGWPQTTILSADVTVAWVVDRLGMSTPGGRLSSHVTNDKNPRRRNVTKNGGVEGAGQREKRGCKKGRADGRPGGWPGQPAGAARGNASYGCGQRESERCASAGVGLSRRPRILPAA